MRSDLPPHSSCHKLHFLSLSYTIQATLGFHPGPQIHSLNPAYTHAVPSAWTSFQTLHGSYSSSLFRSQFKHQFLREAFPDYPNESNSFLLHPTVKSHSYFSSTVFEIKILPRMMKLDYLLHNSAFSSFIVLFPGPSLQRF